MNNAFSVFMLFQHVCSVIGFCIAGILMTVDGYVWIKEMNLFSMLLCRFPPAFEHVTKSGCYMMVYLVQLGMYCYAGNLIITEVH